MTYAEDLKVVEPEEVSVASTDSIEMNRLKNDLRAKVISNVLSEEEFRGSFFNVFRTMSEILSRTLGPYGATTMIDEMKNYTVTKDGFHVLQNLRFANSKHNRIHSTLFSISHQMVTKVGDGSTSAVVAAYKFLVSMSHFLETHKNIRPKDLNETIQEVVKEICDIIAKQAIPVTPENLVDIVYRIANIATNENKEYTNMIKEIYETLGVNCTINIANSDTLENSVVYEDGIYTTEAYLVDRIYHNKADTCVIKNCNVLLFDHVLDTDIWPILETAFNKTCYKESKTLIVVSPSYDQFLMDKMRKDAEEMANLYANKAKIPFRIIFLKAVNLHKPIYKSMYSDLASLLGATIYRPDDTREIIKMVEEYGNKCREAFNNKEEAPDIPEELIDNISKHIGSCEEATMGDKLSSFKGFFNKNEALFNALKHDAELSLKEEEERALRNDAIDVKVFEARTRYSKIICRSATIKIGGANRLERSINFDAVDDAVKACASAIKYGYNKGCNMAIIEAANTLIRKLNSSGADLSAKDAIKCEVTRAIYQAFLSVYKEILKNAFKDPAAVERVAKQSIENGFIPLNLITNQFDMEGKEIINSCRTDIEILRGAITMVGVVLSCNQYISSTLNY